MYLNKQHILVKVLTYVWAYPLIQVTFHKQTAPYNKLIVILVYLLSFMRVICFHFNVMSCIYFIINKKHIQILRCLFRWQWWKCRFTEYCTFVLSSGLNTVIITKSFRVLYIVTLIDKLYLKSYILYYLKQLADLQMLKK